MKRTLITLMVLLGFTLPAMPQEQLDRYLLLSTNRTGTMEKELNDAGERGYRFVATQGGETSFGGNEAVVIMQLDPEGRRFRYMLLATNRTATMQREMNEARLNWESAFPCLAADFRERLRGLPEPPRRD